MKYWAMFVGVSACAFKSALSMPIVVIDHFHVCDGCGNVFFCKCEFKCIQVVMHADSYLGKGLAIPLGII